MEFENIYNNNNNNNNNNQNNNVFYQPTRNSMENKEQRPNKKIKLEGNDFDFDNGTWDKFPENNLIDNNFSISSSKLTESYINLIINQENNENVPNNFHNIIPNNMNNINPTPELTNNINNENNININNNNNNMPFFMNDNHEIQENNSGEMGKMEQPKDIVIELYEPLLKKINGDLKQFELEIDKIYEECKNRIYPDKKFIMLIIEKIEVLRTEIQYLLRKKILHVGNVYYSQWLLQQLMISSKRLTLVNNEIDYFQEKLSKNDAVESLISFVFVDQPLSQSFKNKNRARQVNTKKKSHCNMKAAIISSPNTYFRFVNPVMAHFATKEDTTSKPDITLETNTEEVAKNVLVISFSFRFPVGTRCKPAQLRLEVEGDAYLPQASTKFTTTIKSEISNNFVVATNECQWEGAEGKLLLFDLFGEDYIIGSQKGSKKKKKKNAKDQKESTWPFFINQLSVRFIRATRQEISINELVNKLESGEIESIFKRVFIEIDINYLQEQRFNNQVAVTPQQVETFWEWYGKTLHIFRHNSHIRTIFLEGLFFSLISKERSNLLLQGQRPGSFLIRNSERSTKGEFALAFVSDNDRIKHTKIESQKIQPPHNSLPDYIKDITQLMFVIKPPTIGSKNYLILPKDIAFDKFYTKKIKDVDDGYEEIDD
eukprot:TRINITY_DN2721_c0_g1_i1.p1 TRINITY_DN2721_c0_g1~~TRINITY_DN2721_c0_g1_i1.p1  ORF type:complete len:658 (-),score=239.48 TRINITY_DN2721_c0_g1_i1:114-2087(-)